MKKAIIYLVFLQIILLIPTSCQRGEIEELENKLVEDLEKKYEEEEIIEDKPIKREGLPSPLSGIYFPEEIVNKRPVVIMYDNHPNARWQAGLSKAEVIYEFLVEPPYTRYMAVFLTGEPKSIGPIRSSRPYFITTLLEYDPIYVRVGGSQEAKRDIINLKIADIDGLSSSNKVLWNNKDVGKLAPHNTYTSMEAIRKTQKERGYREEGNYVGFDFNEKDTDITSSSFEKAENIQINYYQNNKVTYLYEEGEKIYYRKTDGVEHLDEYDKSPILAKNIIIQEARSRVIDKVGRMAIDLIGEGKGKYITNGKAIDITWSKETRASKTYFYEEDGKGLVLNPGVTWIQVVNLAPDINIE